MKLIIIGVFAISFIVSFVALFINSYYKLLSRIKIFYKFLFSIFILSTLPLTIFSVSRFIALRVYTLKIQTAKLEAVADLKAENIRYFFKELKNNASSVENIIIAEGFSEDLDTILKRVAKNEKLTDIIIINKDKEIFYTTGNVYRTQEDISILGDIDTESSASYISDLVRARESVHIYIAEPVNLNSEQEGILLVIIDMAQAYELIEDHTGLGKTGKAIIFESTQDNISHESEEVLAIQRTVPEVGLEILVKMDKSEVLEPLAGLRLSLMAFLGGTTFFVLLISYFLARSIIGRVEDLSKIVKNLADGKEFDWQLSKKWGVDEVGTLARSIEKMTGNMHKAQDELKKRYEELSRFSRVTVGRELRMAELKEELRRLREEKKK